MSLPTLQQIKTPAGTLAYRRAGSGPPLLLIHGWGASSRHWLGAFATLPARHDVIALDLPGFGASPPPRGSAQLPTLANAVLALCDALGLTRLALGGHSLGAAVALVAAAQRPALAERLLLASFGLPRGPVEAAQMALLHAQLTLGAAAWAPWLDAWRPWLAAAAPWGAAVWSAPPLAAMLAAPLLRSGVPAAALAIGVADLAVVDARAACEAFATTGDPRVVAAAAGIAAPALVLSGAGDPLFPVAAARQLAETLPAGTLTLLERCGHIPMAEQPAAFYGAIAAFLTGA